jgi:hypothetical protein
MRVAAVTLTMGAEELVKAGWADCPLPEFGEHLARALVGIGRGIDGQRR